MRKEIKKIGYRDANKYATVLCRGKDSKDLVHDAYLYHYENHQTDLFDQPTKYVLRTIKNLYYNKHRATKYIENGELISPTMLDIFDTEVSGGITPDKALISKEFIEEFNNRVKNYGQSSRHKMPENILLTVLKYLEDGFTLTEISKEVDMKFPRLHNYKLKLETIANEMREYEPHNPFNGNSTVVIKVVKRDTYNKNPDKYAEFVYDTDRGADSNEWFMLLVNSEAKGLLIREDYKESQHTKY
jgi:DNA-directed RNA polymerase specialized sigma24 family protein